MKSLLLTGFALATAAANARTYGFDDAEALLYNGTNAATASVLDNRYDGIFLSHFRGVDPVTGQQDPYSPVTAISYADWGLSSVSGINALDGNANGSLVVDLNPTTYPLGSTFGISIVDQGFGDDNATVRFLNAAGTQIDAASINLSHGGRFTYSAKPFASVILPQGAFYDDLTITPVPEPSAFLAIGIGALGLLRRRRR